MKNIYLILISLLLFNINGFAQPANNLCANATPLPCGTSNLAGTTVNTTNITDGTGCTVSNYGVWYTFVGDGQSTTISSTAAAGYDHEMDIVSGSCGTLSSIVCDDGALSGGTETHTFTSTLGTTYYIYILLIGVEVVQLQVHLQFLELAQQHQPLQSMMTVQGQ